MVWEIMGDEEEQMYITGKSYYINSYIYAFAIEI